MPRNILWRYATPIRFPTTPWAEAHGYHSMSLCDKEIHFNP